MSHVACECTRTLVVLTALTRVLTRVLMGVSQAFAMRLAVMPLIVAALAGVQQSNAKVLAGTIQLDGEFPEHYISKFSINQEGLIKGKLSTETGEAFTTGGLSMFLYNAEDWPEYAKQVTCMDRARLAKYRFQIGRDGGGDISAEQERQASAILDLGWGAVLGVCVKYIGLYHLQPLLFRPVVLPEAYHTNTMPL